MRLTEAGRAEILRAAQRDEQFREHLAKNSSELLQLCAGIPLWIRYNERVQAAMRVLYDVVTTLLDLQTLGEEYTGLVQVNSTGTSLPQKYVQVLMILLSHFGRPLFLDLVKRCEKKLETLPEDHPLEDSVRQQILKLLHIIRVLLPYFELFHKCLFYLNGSYYSIAKRMCGVRYALVRYWLKDQLSVPAFRLMGFVTLVSGLLQLRNAYKAIRNMEDAMDSSLGTRKSTEPVTKSNQCPLCLNIRQHTTITPCGHLFCWHCIIEWLQQQPKCPICRQHVKPSRVVYIRNQTD